MLDSPVLLHEDLAVMVEEEQGHYRLRAGSICTAGSWRLQDKVGLTLDDIHFKGSVPNYAEKYQKSMNRFFSSLREDKLVERNNYFFQVDGGLSWSTQTNGTEKIFDQYNKCAQLGTFEKTDGAVKPTPATHTYLIPVVDWANEPGVPDRMASGLLGASLSLKLTIRSLRLWSGPQGERNADRYKGGELFNPVLLPSLDQKHKEQVRSGAVQFNEKGTTDEQYPL
ncbi:hypothetical protein JCM1841_007105 [Sporobolomyces salmonicolor]